MKRSFNIWIDQRNDFYPSNYLPIMERIFFKTIRNLIIPRRQFPDIYIYIFLSSRDIINQIHNLEYFHISLIPRNQDAKIHIIPGAEPITINSYSKVDPKYSPNILIGFVDALLAI